MRKCLLASILYVNSYVGVSYMKRKHKQKKQEKQSSTICFKLRINNKKNRLCNQYTICLWRINLVQYHLIESNMKHDYSYQ